MKTENKDTVIRIQSQNLHQCQTHLTHWYFWGAVYIYIIMLFTGREVRMGKNCARGLEYGPRPKAEGRAQDQGHSFFPIRTDLDR